MFESKYKKGLYISELNEPGDVPHSIFGIEKIEIRQTRNQNEYLDIALCDKTGSINGKMWNCQGISLKELSDSGFVEIEGKIEYYNNSPQIIILKLGPIMIDDNDPILKEIIRTTSYDIDFLWYNIERFIRDISDKNLRYLLKNIITDEKIRAFLRIRPAAAKIHHAYAGGLLEHIYNVLCIINALKKSGIYKKINWDLLMTGGILHDLGKIHELCSNKQLSDHKYSKIGLLFGHIFIGSMIINKYINELDGFDENLKMELIHLILSHHGNLEWGSPVEAKTPEAILLHCIDHMDAQLSHCFEMLERSRDTDSDFTDKYQSVLRKQYYKSKNNIR